MQCISLALSLLLFTIGCSGNSAEEPAAARNASEELTVAEAEANLIASQEKYEELLKREANVKVQAAEQYLKEQHRGTGASNNDESVSSSNTLVQINSTLQAPESYPGDGVVDALGQASHLAKEVIAEESIRVRLSVRSIEMNNEVRKFLFELLGNYDALLPVAMRLVEKERELQLTNDLAKEVRYRADLTKKYSEGKHEEIEDEYIDNFENFFPRLLVARAHCRKVLRANRYGWEAGKQLENALLAHEKITQEDMYDIWLGYKPVIDAAEFLLEHHRLVREEIARAKQMEPNILSMPSAEYGEREQKSFRFERKKFWGFDEVPEEKPYEDSVLEVLFSETATANEFGNLLNLLEGLYPIEQKADFVTLLKYYRDIDVSDRLCTIRGWDKLRKDVIPVNSESGKLRPGLDLLAYYQQRTGESDGVNLFFNAKVRLKFDGDEHIAAMAPEMSLRQSLAKLDEYGGGRNYSRQFFGDANGNTKSDRVRHMLIAQRNLRTGGSQLTKTQKILNNAIHYIKNVEDNLRIDLPPLTLNIDRERDRNVLGSNAFY